jgi:hypothetical protein
MPTPDDGEYLLIPDVVREHIEQLDEQQHEMVKRLGLLAPQPADYVGEPAAARIDRLIAEPTHFEQRPIGAYTAPNPPPADMPVDPAKWASLPRKKRRELIRYHRKQLGGR